MAARQNFVVVLPRCWHAVRSTLGVMQKPIEDWIGPLTQLSVQNFTTGSTDDLTIAVSPASNALPEVSDDEIVVFYPLDQRRGCVLVSHEGSHDLIVLSLAEHAPVLDRLSRIWELVGSEADAVLAGEELEVEDEQIGALFESGHLPEELDLCDAAIVKLPCSTPGPRAASQRSRLSHGGRLLLR